MSRLFYLSIVGVCLVISLTAARGAAQDNPARERFNTAITFYLSFEHGLDAEMARGKAEPTRVEGEAKFLPGLFGRAALLSAPDKTSILWYTTLGGNVDLTRPGAMMIWICPHEWVRREDEDYFFPAKIMSNYAELMFGRQGRLREGRVDLVYLWGKVGQTKDVLISGGDSLKWENGEWHLWVMNWRSSSIEFSLDGAALNRADTPMRFNTAWDGSGHSHLLVGAQNSTAPYLVDELMVLNRPLSDEEVKQIYEEGIQRALSHKETGE